MTILMIQRAPQFSPNSVEKDLAILEAVATRLRTAGHHVELRSEISLEDTRGLSPVCEAREAHGDCPLCVFSMARLPETLAWLKTLKGIRIINAPEGVENCSRATLETIMTRIGTPMPPKEGSHGYWLKRGDAAAQSSDDVQYAPDRSVLEAKIQTMEARGISSYTVSAHVVGDLVKFYGVRGTGFFRYYYPTDDGDTKFSDEQHNGSARHYPFDVAHLQTCVEALAEAVGIEVYGGDGIVRSDGTFCIIDFNDWPSFSRCREEAADAIAQIVKS